jgi:hypothetical protein
MKDKLSKDDWRRLREILHSLFDITWEYSELNAKNISSNLEDSKPQRFENEPFKNYNQRLLNWDKSKTDTYTRTFNDSKSKSFNLISELEELLIKLGMPTKQD